MKNIKNIIKLLLLLFVIVSCSNDDDSESSSGFTDVAFTTNYGTDPSKESEVNQYGAFLDISAGATYHEWRIPEGAFFLKGPIPNKAKTFDQFIINPGDTVTNDRTALVLFKEGNSNTRITLYNEFDEYTEFVLPVGFDDGDLVLDTTRTIFKDDKWIYEYDIIVDVYDTIVPDMTIRDIDGNLIDFKNTDVIDVKFEDKLIFEDLLSPSNNARPDETKWRVFTIEENEDDEETIFNGSTQIDTISFNKRIGTFKGTLRSKRIKTEDVNADEELYEMPVVFNVTPLDEDLVVGSIEERADNTLLVRLSSRINAIEGDVSSNFTVTVNGAPRIISAVGLNPGVSSANFLLITLDTPIEQTDTATVSYDGNSTAIASLDGRQLQAFTSIPVDVFIIIPAIQTGPIVELVDEKIVVPFDIALDQSSFTGDTQGFEVLVNGTPFAIDNITPNIDDSNKIDIRLTDPIFRSDVITVSSDGTSTIKALGDGPIQAFTAQTVIMDNGDILNGDGNFEDASKWGDFGNAKPNLTIGAPSVANDGDAAHLTAPDGSKADIRSTGTYPFESGKTYVWTYKRFISASNTTIQAKNYIGGTQIKPVVDKYTGAANPSGVWETKSFEFTVPATGNFLVRIQAIPAGICDVYYDDIVIAEKEERP